MEYAKDLEKTLASLRAQGLDAHKLSRVFRGKGEDGQEIQSQPVEFLVIFDDPDEKTASALQQKQTQFGAFAKAKLENPALEAHTVYNSSVWQSTELRSPGYSARTRAKIDQAIYDTIARTFLSVELGVLKPDLWLQMYEYDANRYAAASQILEAWQKTQEKAVARSA